MSEGIVLGFESACSLWRRVGERVALRNQPDERVAPLLIRLLFDKGTGVDLSDLPQRCRVTRIPASVDAPKLRIFQGELGEGEAVLHLCVSRRTGRRFVSGAICHLMSGSYPAGSFSRIEDGVLVASPELTFMQMTRTFSSRTDTSSADTSRGAMMSLGSATAHRSRACRASRSTFAVLSSFARSTARGCHGGSPRPVELSVT